MGADQHPPDKYLRVMVFDEWPFKSTQEIRGDNPKLKTAYVHFPALVGRFCIAARSLLVYIVRVRIFGTLHASLISAVTRLEISQNTQQASRITVSHLEFDMQYYRLECCCSSESHCWFNRPASCHSAILSLPVQVLHQQHSIAM